jgi:hypothetical protein
MMNKEEIQALSRVVCWLFQEENRAMYEGSFRKENNDIQILDDYLCGLISTGSLPS